MIQAEAVRLLSGGRNRDGLLQHLIDICLTSNLRERLEKVRDQLKNSDPTEDVQFLETITDVGFQLYAPDAVATVLWVRDFKIFFHICHQFDNLQFFFRYSDPEQCLVRCVALGGDCDTTGAMLGALLGAAYGVQWIPARWYCMLENGTHGRDYAIKLGRELSAMNHLSVAEKNQVVAHRPLYSLIAKVIPVICSHFGKTERDLVDWYNPELQLKNAATKELWMSLFDLVVEQDGMIRYDIASSLLSFFSDRKGATCPKSLDRMSWSVLFDEISKNVSKSHAKYYLRPEKTVQEK